MSSSGTRPLRRVYIENLGCAKNQVDAEVMLSRLLESGQWSSSDTADAADLIIVNTCGFITDAREESLNTLFDLRSAYPGKRIIFAGCMAEHYGREIGEELVEADGLFGNMDLSRITEIADAVMEGSRAELYPALEDETGGDEELSREYITRRRLFSFPGSAYLKISEGCSHHCRYCAIPLIRGDLRSRPAADVITDAADLISSGVREINLIAQDLAAYGTDRGKLSGEAFLGLLERLTALDGDFTLRMLYIHPDDFPADLPQFVRAHPKVLPYFDIPFQHAATPVLREMGRRGTADTYLRLLDDIRSTLPDAVIRSTFMLAHPGERKSHIMQLREFLGSASLDWAGFFIYSPEEHTSSYYRRRSDSHARAAGRVREALEELKMLQEQITAQRLQRWVGRELDVLVEEKITGEDLLIGRTFAQAPEVDGSTVVMSRAGEPGELLRCGIRRVVGIDLEAVPVEQ